jgi:cell division protein FtsL
MSLARNLKQYEYGVAGAPARSLPAPERAQPKARPATRVRKHARRALVVTGLGWALVLTMSLFLVHRNTQVLAVEADITRMKEELVLLERQQMERETLLAQSVSLEAVERWALAHNMKRPAEIKPLVGDPTAVALQPDAAPQAEAPAGPQGFWASVQFYLSRLVGSSAQGSH